MYRIDLLFFLLEYTPGKKSVGQNLAGEHWVSEFFRKSGIKKLKTKIYKT